MPLNRRLPIREHAFRLGVTIGGFLLGLVVVAIVLAASGRPAHGAVWIVLAVIAVIALGTTIGAYAIGTSIGGRLLVGDRVEVAFRRPGERWRHGRLAVPAPGRLTLQRYRWQVRIPAGDPEELGHPGLGPDTGRRPSLRQIWRVNPQLHIVELTTDSGPLEVAMLPSRVGPLRDRLESPEVDSIS